MTTRRELLAAGAAITAAAWSGEAFAQSLPRKSKMGIGSASLGAYSRGREGAADSVAVVEYCRSLGAGGLQFSPSGDLARVRRRLEELEMWVEGNARLPSRLSDDTAAFEKSLLDAKAVGASVVRAVSRSPQGFSGRRYESFKSLEEFEAWQAEANAIVLKCLPIAEKIGVKIALENHKDRLVDDHVAFLKATSSEYLGALVDPGNNLALLEQPVEVCTKLAPYALACSMKDMGVALYEDGFLLSEVLFGDGVADQAALFKILNSHNKINPVEELITRDPLKVPCLTDAYWVSMPKDRRARDQARHMAWVRTKASKLPYVDQLTPEGRLQAEADNHRRTLEWWTAKVG
ncbi:MAG: TIM barrel protein [Pseudomonadota bacterium]|uniref:sugar phosphate isomerase/epimerase family protein n=1 Tax=Phenylobacterium sp. TaxID=1871053 RepID=UPI0025E19FD7|nr:TIM barrel protein [Phenylobacterium sp.]MBT9470631.1 TIM barrel protein [Phenylobacterium sp.]